MFLTRVRVTYGLIPAFFMSQASIVSADQVSTTLDISVDVVTAACSIDPVNPADFGSVSPDDPDPTLPISVTVTCANGTAYKVGMDYGQNFNEAREVTNGSSAIPYQIYKSGVKTGFWGDRDLTNGTTPPGFSSVSGTGTGAP